MITSSKRSELRKGVICGEPTLIPFNYVACDSHSDLHEEYQACVELELVGQFLSLRDV